MSKRCIFYSENMNNVYETFGEEETIVLTDLLREYVGKYKVLDVVEPGSVFREVFLHRLTIY